MLSHLGNSEIMWTVTITVDILTFPFGCQGCSRYSVTEKQDRLWLCRLMDFGVRCLEGFAKVLRLSGCVSK